MPKFMVNASEVVFYAIEVEAESKDEAVEKVYFMNPTEYEIVGGDHFQIEEIVEVENAETEES